MQTDGDVIIGVKFDESEFEEGIEKLEKTDVDTKFNGLNKVVGLIGTKLKGALATTLGISRAVIGMIAKLGLIGVLIGALAFIGKIIGEAFEVATSENETLRVQLEYIKYAIHNIATLLAGTIGKIITWIISMVFKLLTLIGGLIKAVTGINIFSGVTADNFAKAQKSAVGLKKATGAIKKNLYGWDEMTRVEDANGGGLLGGVGGLGSAIDEAMGKIPDFESAVEEAGKNIRKWLFELPSREELEQMYEPARAVWGSLGTWVQQNVGEPIKVSFKTLAEYLKPLWEPVVKEIKRVFGPIYNWLKEKVIDPITERLKTFKDSFLTKYAKFINKIIYYINMVFGIFGVNIDYIDEEASLTGEDIEKNVKNKLDEISQGHFGIDIIDNSVQDASKDVGSLLDKLTTLKNKVWTVTTNFVSSGLTKIKDSLFKLGIKIPGLAVGGIVNMPGRGVPLGGAITGERGQEGVIPLTNSQQMALLGEAIGRYITISATVPVYVGNRQVAREIRQIEAEEDFAGNR